MTQFKKIVLAYSGGLDTSVILKWLKNEYHCEVVAYAAELGQGKELAGIEAKAMATGASQVFVDDLRDEFVSDYVFPMFRGNAIYEGTYLLGTSIARPLIAKRQIEIARQVGADAVAHGSTGKGNDQVRFELTYHAMEPGITVIAPWRTWDLNSREKLINYARENDIPIPVTKEKPYSSDRNLLHISFEGGVLEDPWNEPPEDMFVMSVSPEQAPDQPLYVEIDFRAGDPVAIDGKFLAPGALLQKLNDLGGSNGIGRVDLVENRFVGMKSRGVYETPGGTILYHAHRALESITMDREVMFLRDSLVPEYARMIYNGFWFAPERLAMQAFIDHSQQNVTGTVRLKLYKGNCIVVGRKSPQTLYYPELATFEEDTVYNQQDAEGFIKLNALRLKAQSILGSSRKVD
ncbi:MAG TPA: argininosuccinate synthase [Proteobacteria bacterium]|nr:argininosuccinate synthase [Pseudomonadota bacterium]